MRRSLAAASVALATALTILPSLSSATDGAPAPAADPGPTAEERADQALAAATELFTDERGRPDAEEGSEEEGTLVLRDLFVSLRDLDPAEREEGMRILARPTDGSTDPDGYSAPSTKKCRDNVCVHWVRESADAPPSDRWALRNLKVMNRVWNHEVGRMGYRKPLSDKPLGRSRNGGNGKFDVYLKDVGSRGLYGYCVPEAGPPGERYEWRAISYCVLDNDFASAQFGGQAPGKSLAATAAHEFFHAVQFSYDYGEDAWFMEATATWMEERYADDVNDNRQFLPVGQVAAPHIPLDTHSSLGTQYGNWAFWEYLSKRFGNTFVRQTWERTAPRRSGNRYSTKTLKAQLKARGGFEKVYRSFVVANLNPARTYPEGKTWPKPAMAGKLSLSRSDRSQRGSIAINHLAAQHVLVRPQRSLRGARWALRVVVDGPGRATSPNAAVTVKKRSGKITTTTVRLNRKGAGKVVVPFSRRSVRSVTVSLINASTRFACYRNDPTDNPQYSCLGNPRDDARTFALKVAAFKR